MHPPDLNTVERLVEPNWDAMTDTFKNTARSLTSPPEFGAPVTPSNSSDLPYVSRALYVGGAGNIAIRLQDGTDLVLANVPTGTLLPIRAARVLASGTTATLIVELW